MNVEKGRLGSFFVFIGLVLLVIFFTTDQAQNPSYGFFFFGAFSLLGGGYLIWRDFKPSTPVERFRGLRAMQARSKEQKARREAAKAAKKQKH